MLSARNFLGRDAARRAGVIRRPDVGTADSASVDEAPEMNDANAPFGDDATGAAAAAGRASPWRRTGRVSAGAAETATKRRAFSTVIKTSAVVFCHSSARHAN